MRVESESFDRLDSAGGGGALYTSLPATFLFFLAPRIWILPNLADALTIF